MTITIHAPTLATLTWHPHLGPVVCGVLLLLLAGWVPLLYRRMRLRMSRARCWVLLVPRLLALLLLWIAVFDPAWSLTRHLDADRRALIVTDQSSSMTVRDSPEFSRLERARRVAEEIEQLMGNDVGVDHMVFDTELRESTAASGPDDGETRGTDLGSALHALARHADISMHEAVILLTDGGDEVIDAAILPPVPLHVVGIGSDAAGLNDIMIAGLRHPATVEKDAQFEVRMDVRVTGDTVFTSGLEGLAVQLEEKRGGTWAGVAVATPDVSKGRARVRLNASSSTAGTRLYRISMAPQPDEVSTLNNFREFSVDVHKQALHVLFFTRELGASFKAIRGELARDPGIAFTALYRTIGERFTLQGERRAGDEQLEAGLPSDAGVLRMFDCIIIGSFPRDEWREDQMQALADYAAQGGAIVFLGGESSFTPEYAGTPLDDLVPWHLAGAAEGLLRGRFPVSIPRAAEDDPIVAGLSELLPPDAFFESVNDAGNAKPAATTLMQAASGSRSLSVIAVQSYGSGKVLAIGGNTMWLWARGASELPTVFGTLWRQAVRALSGKEEGGRLLSIRWDKARYRPGERARAEIRVAGRKQAGRIRFAGTLSKDEKTQRLTVAPAPDSGELHVAEITFPERGDYLVKLTVYRDETTIESYEKLIRVAPFVGEGVDLAVDHRFLADLAHRGGGTYVKEDELASLVAKLSRPPMQRTAVIETSLVHGSPWFAVLFVTVLVTEWIMRRRCNLF